MFCSECGAKNEKGAKFCENCGSPVNNQIVEKEIGEHIADKKEKPLLSKKGKIILISTVAIVVLLLGSFFTLKSFADPGKLAKEYFNAVVDYNVDKIYSFMEIEKSPYTTKELFKKLMGDGENKKIEIINSKIIEKKLSSNGLTMNITIAYTTKDSKKTDDVTITLIKDKKKKWLFFDNWKLHTEELQTISDSELKVMKDSKITIEGIELDKKYLDSSKTTDKMDVYKLPAMFQTTYKLTAVLPLGMNIEEELEISNYDKTYTLELTKEQLSEDTKNKINEAAKKALENIYKGAVENKKFADIKSNFEYKDIDLKELETEYQEIANTLTNATTKLTLFTVNTIEIRDLEVSEDGKLDFSVKVDYNYTVSYQDFDGSQKTNQGKNYKYMEVSFVFVDNNFYLTSADDLPDYFSRYY